MSLDNTITVIDIWSSKIKTVIWRISEDDKDHFSILWVGIATTNAIRKWNILDMEEFKSNLDKSLWEAEWMAWEHILWAYITLNTSSTEVVDCKWVIAIQNDITYEDIPGGGGDKHD